MFGFGSSFLSSASNLITSAEPKTTPPSPRKMSTTAPTSPKPTPPASPKTVPPKDTKPPIVQKEPSPTTRPEVKEGLGKQEAAKTPPQQRPKSPTPQAKAPAQPAKQESGGFFGFGGPKTPPTAPKSAESVTGKMFGFGSSFLSSASTLITSAVQDESKTTPPVSPKMSPAREAKSPVAQKSEPPKQTKPPPSVQPKVEKGPSEPPKATPVIKDTTKESLSTCPLCKVELNMGSKDPPNYNTCTECKNAVCNLCGFNPMPHTGAKEWLCLNCQTQRALLGQLGDSGKMSQPSPVSAKPETQSTPAIKKSDPKTMATKPMPAPTKSQPAPVLSVVAESQPLPSAKEEPIMPPPPVQETVVTKKVEPPNKSVPKTVTVENKEHVVKTELLKDEVSKVDPAKVKDGAGVAVISSVPSTKATVAPVSTVSADVSVAQVVPVSETKPELSPAERMIKEVKPGDHTKVKEPTKPLEQVGVEPQSQKPQPEKEIKPVTTTDSKKVADKLAEKVAEVPSSLEPEVSTLDNIIKVRMYHFM
uniref:Zinc finger piccolo-type domain-containing protein n=1 Tax=Sphaeramia orbicularis TaxID=375764 RepID=A0A673B0D0_9TELE